MTNDQQTIAAMLEAREKAAAAHTRMQAAEGEWRRLMTAAQEAEQAVAAIPALKAGCAIIVNGQAVSLSKDSMSSTARIVLNPVSEGDQ